MSALTESEAPEIFDCRDDDDKLTVLRPALRRSKTVPALLPKEKRVLSESPFITERRPCKTARLFRKQRFACSKSNAPCSQRTWAYARRDIYNRYLLPRCTADGNEDSPTRPRRDSTESVELVGLSFIDDDTEQEGSAAVDKE